MRSRIILVVSAGLLLAMAALTQTSSPDELTRPGRSQARPAQRAKTEAPAAEAASAAQAQEMEAMRGDLERMRSLLTQMQNNLAFVQNTVTPLKHQFELNNEMWQMLLNDMERRLQKMQSLPRAKP